MKHYLLFANLLLWICSSSLHALSEEAIKAAYLERFAMFIEWPHPIKNYHVCIYNDPVFATLLQNTYASRPFNKMSLKVTALEAGSPVEEMSKCHMVYYRGSKPAQNEKQLAQLQKNHILTIGDSENDPKKGAIIGFYLEKNNFRFIINQRNLENASLSASYKLLKFATIIEPTGESK